MEQSNETPKKFSLTKVIKLTPSSTPKINKSINFAASLRKKNAFYLLPEANYNTPSPTSKNRIVKNPFEPHLTDRLHLPVISSPSLFQHPQTPKHSSRHEDFEWSIDEVSCLHPANFHPHETQFKENIDPEVEAKAQAAITTFFSEHNIVPSPHDCQLRKQKIFMQDDSFTNLMIVNSTALSHKKKSPVKEDCVQKRNNFAQTTLTFPPDLPKEVEDVLKKYSIFNEDQQQNLSLDHSMSDTDKSNQFMDISTLRRKLFGAKHIPQEVDSDDLDSPIIIRNISRTPARSPDLGLHEIKAKMDDSLCSEMFGELSPISNNPTPSAKKKKNNENQMSVELDNSEEDDLVLSQSFEKEKDNDFDISSEQTTPTRKTRASRKGKLRGKNLSTSFCLLQNEFDEEFGANEKENHRFITRKPTIFRRMDSGFNDESSSNLSMMEHFESIDENKENSYYHQEMPAIKEPLKILENRMILKNRNSSFCDNHDLSFNDVSMQSETDFMCSTQKN